MGVGDDLDIESESKLTWILCGVRPQIDVES